MAWLHVWDKNTHLAQVKAVYEKKRRYLINQIVSFWCTLAWKGKITKLALCKESSRMATLKWVSPTVVQSEFQHKTCVEVSAGLTMQV